jgi:hypothetical protein
VLSGACVDLAWICGGTDVPCGRALCRPLPVTCGPLLWPRLFCCFSLFRRPHRFTAGADSLLDTSWHWAAKAAEAVVGAAETAAAAAAQEAGGPAAAGAGAGVAGRETGAAGAGEGRPFLCGVW